MNPTLWRTCRVLEGPTRRQLLRRIVLHPGQTVSELADAMKLSLPRASQELRRLQSRGLIQASRAGRRVRYRAAPDPQVPSAAPILSALRNVFQRHTTSADETTQRTAAAFSHTRRIAVVRQLLRAPLSGPALSAATDIPAQSLARHLRLLQKLGFVTRRRQVYRFSAGRHPLAQCMARLIKQRPAH